MNILVVAPKSRPVYNFRGDLIREMIKKGNTVTAVGPEDEYRKEIESMGVKYICLKMNKTSISVLHDIKYCLSLRKIIKSEKIDMTFAFTIKPVVYGSIAAKTCGLKNIYSMIAGLGRLFGEKRGIKTTIVRMISGMLYKTAFKCCNKVFFQNQDDLEEFVKYGYLKREKTQRVNGSGVNMERFSPTGLPEIPTFLMVSRVLKDKGVFEFIEAAKILKSKHPEAKCILLGGFDSAMGAITHDELKPYIDSGAIEFPGETKNVQPYFENASVFVLPTYYREGIPRTILEALANKMPVITTNMPGCKETVEEGKNGFLIPIKNAEALAEKMEWFVNHPDETEKMAGRSLEICKEKFDVNKVNRVILDTMGL